MTTQNTSKQTETKSEFYETKSKERKKEKFSNWTWLAAQITNP